jgi:hypothetical protein
LPSESRAGVPIRSPVQTETRVVDVEDLVEVVVVERRSVPARRQGDLRDPEHVLDGFAR